MFLKSTLKTVSFPNPCNKKEHCQYFNYSLNAQDHRQPVSAPLSIEQRMPGGGLGVQGTETTAEMPFPAPTCRVCREMTCSLFCSSTCLPPTFPDTRIIRQGF